MVEKIPEKGHDMTNCVTKHDLEAFFQNLTKANLGSITNLVTSSKTEGMDLAFLSIIKKPSWVVRATDHVVYDPSLVCDLKKQ